MIPHECSLKNVNTDYCQCHGLSHLIQCFTRKRNISAFLRKMDSNVKGHVRHLTQKGLILFRQSFDYICFTDLQTCFDVWDVGLNWSFFVLPLWNQMERKILEQIKLSSLIVK